MSVDVSLKIKTGTVLRLGSRVGSGRKVVVVDKKVDTRNKIVRVDYLNIVDHGQLLSEARGWTTYRLDEQVQFLGVWSGNLWSGSYGKIQYNPGLDGLGEEGEVTQVATKTSARKGKAATKSKAANKSKSNGGEKKRATDEELDELAEQVVDLRDNEELSWTEIEEQLDIAPSRLRSLYNRGGGEPTRKRQGAAAAKEKPKAKKGKKTRKRSEDPSDED